MCRPAPGVSRVPERFLEEIARKRHIATSDSCDGASVQTPLRRKERRWHRGLRCETLLDPGALTDARRVRVRGARVLVRLAEQVLTVDQRQPPTEQVLEVEPVPIELFLLVIDSPPDDVLWGEAISVDEALRNTAACARPRDDERVLVEVDERRVVQVDRQLEREERPQRWVGRNELEHFLQRFDGK